MMLPFLFLANFRIEDFYRAVYYYEKRVVWLDLTT
jgi:hypothetical protein